MKTPTYQEVVFFLGILLFIVGTFMLLNAYGIASESFHKCTRCLCEWPGIGMHG